MDKQTIVFYMEEKLVYSLLLTSGDLFITKINGIYIVFSLKTKELTIRRDLALGMFIRLVE